MSELKVLVDGKEREIRGVNEETTCENIILVLAKAAGKTGKVALLEKWRGYKRILTPDESPLKCMQSWGSYKHDVTLILQDENLSSNSNLDKTSINLIADDKSDQMKGSFDCESQETVNVVNFQERKLERLVRAIELLNLQFSCYNGYEEAFLYLTEEEIADDLSAELEKVLKLQGQELVEWKTWENEMKSLEQTSENLSKQRDVFDDKILKLEERIAEAYDAVDMLLEELEQEEKAAYKESRNFQADNALVREELEVVSKELSEQNALFYKQELELNSISSIVLDLNTSIRNKKDSIVQLNTELESCKDDFCLLENFRPKVPEAESTKRFGISINIGLYENDIETTEPLESMKINSENRKTRSSCAEIEKLTEVAQNEEIGRNLSKEEACFKSEEQQSEISEKLHKLSSLSKSFLEYGVDERDRFPISNTAEITHRQNSQKFEKSSKFTSTVSKECRSISPEVETKFSDASSTYPTKNTPTSNKTPTTQPSDTSKLHSKSKESCKKVQEGFERQNANESILKRDRNDQDLNRNAGSPSIAPKPLRSRIFLPHLENSVSPLEEKLSNSDGPIYKTLSETRKNLLVIPKPYGKGVTRAEVIPVVRNSSKARNNSLQSAKPYVGLSSTQKSSSLSSNHSSGINSSDSRLNLSSKNIDNSQVIQSNKNSGLTLTQENSKHHTKLPEMNKNVNYLEMAKDKTTTKLTAKPYDRVNILHFGESKMLDKRKLTSEYRIGDADFQSSETQNRLEHSVKTPTRPTRTQNNTNDRTNLYISHSTSLISQPLPSPVQSSTTYLTSPTVSNNMKFSKKKRIAGDDDAAEKGIFV